MNAVYKQNWIESERGWGIRPDGVSLHLSIDECATYIKKYWEGMPDDAPDEYSRPSGHPILVEVSDEVYNKVHAAQGEHGLRIWQHELSKFNL